MEDYAETYQKRIQSLNLDKLDSDETRKTVLDSFASKYVLLPETWKMRIQLEKNLPYSEMKKLIKKALNDFYSEEVFDSLDSQTKELFMREENPFDRCLNPRYLEDIKKKRRELLGQSQFEEILKDALTFPHSRLSLMLGIHKKFSGKFLTKKSLYNSFHLNFALYQKIEESENDLYTWSYYIQYNKDDRFIIQSFECRLAKNPFEVELWKRYMTYLVTVNKKAAVDVYHRYRKLFIGDESMNDIFLNLDVKASFSNINFLGKAKFRRPNLKRKIPHSSKSLTVYTRLPKIQAFSFRASFLNYFLKHASMELAIKLFHSCKQLYFFKKIPFCHSIFVGSNSFVTKYFKDSLFINETAINRLPNVCLEMNLVIEKCSNCNILSNNIIPKLKTCNLGYLNISDQNISTAEYEFLTKSEAIAVIIFDSSVSINDNNGNSITLQALLKNLTYAHHIVIPIKISITDKTAMELTRMKWKKPNIGWVHIQISNASISFPSAEMIQLCTKNKGAQMLVIRISWDTDIADEQRTRIDISMHNALHEWKKNYPNEKAYLLSNDLE